MPPLRLLLERLQLDPDVTIGAMSADGEWQCWTLEDTVRPPGAAKVFGQTAIPVGTYQVILTMSAHFGRELPLVVNVPGFAGVRIHPGNTAADTEGCVLVGCDRLAKSLGRSRVAFDALMLRMREAWGQGRGVQLEVRNP